MNTKKLGYIVAIVAILVIAGSLTYGITWSHWYGR